MPAEMEADLHALAGVFLQLCEEVVLVQLHNLERHAAVDTPVSHEACAAPNAVLGYFAGGKRGGTHREEQGARRKGIEREREVGRVERRREGGREEEEGAKEGGTPHRTPHRQASGPGTIRFVNAGQCGARGWTDGEVDRILVLGQGHVDLDNYSHVALIRHAW